MSSATVMSPRSSISDITAKNLGNTPFDEVVEVGLLLPAPWANALMELSKSREESVAQILRSMIGHALQDAS